MAYKTSLVCMCQSQECYAVATCQVFNQHNEPIGYFCGGHADKQIDKLNLLEKRMKERVL